MDPEIIAKINSYKRFSNNKIWQSMVEEIKKKIAACDVVINTIGGDSQVAYSMRDVSILKRDAYYDLIKIPEDIINSLMGTTAMPTENMDSYESRDYEELDDDE